ncbi:NADH-quinone oxidoreductase subunit K [Aquisalimonas asiatica]|uniref:Multisubunit sodium/proton antiporter, MrpC subunit n=1 Tax=Aquisalimonas asiatica TaxID=406100 RepID=A0A1H8PSZ5_9GAMM|nr:NADH-quinone oxidoreductase subunit K [Aquisalimonas asiatica]SEO45152.1 multisubunit sodium/proton antiporter, MrpC subunit [Aquisalimonas asiatica]
MTALDPFIVATAALVAVGFYGFITQQHPLRRLLAINIFGNGVFMSMILIAYWMPGGPDPVLHAMVITGLVIAVSATAFGLALVRRQIQDANRDRDRDDD